MSRLRKRLANMDKIAGDAQFMRKLIEPKLREICNEINIDYDDGAIDAFYEFLSDNLNIDFYKLSDAFQKSLNEFKTKNDKGN